jgi:DNA primase
MDLKLLKKKIYEEEKIETLLDSLNCENIKLEQSGNLIIAQLPDGDNKRSIQIKNNENLTANIRSKGISGNIFSIVGYILYNATTFEEVRENLYQIIQYICNTLDYELEYFNGEPEEKKTDWCYFLRNVQKDRKKDFKLSDIPTNKVLNENILNQYIDYLYIDWWKEGISERTRKLYKIKFDLRSNRIVIPIYNEFGLVGIKGRYVYKDRNEEENNDIPKYFPLYNFYKSIELFNYDKALEYIKQQKQVIIMESEKSCIKAWQWGIKNCVGIMGGDISPAQIYKLKKIGIDVEFIFMPDKDKFDNGDKEKILIQQVNQIKNRIVKIMNDKDNLLRIDKKHSPTDLDKETFIKLLNEYTIKV